MTKVSTRLREWADHIANDEPALCGEAADIIDKQKALLDECERVIDDLLHYGHPDWPVCQRALVTLAKIRSEKQTAVLNQLSELEQDIDSTKPL